MRELIVWTALTIAGAIGGSLLVLQSASMIAPSSDYDRLPHADWYCSDVRIDSLSLPLTPECWEYKRKDSHQNAQKGTANAKE